MELALNEYRSVLCVIVFVIPYFPSLSFSIFGNIKILVQSTPFIVNNKGKKMRLME